MSVHGEQILLRVYLQSADRAPRDPTHERIVRSARKSGLAGATTLRGILGFGSHGVIAASAWALVQHVPVIVEIVDTTDKLVPFIEGPLAETMHGGMATLERANVMLYRHRRQDDPRRLRLGELLKPLSTLPPINVRPPMKINEHGILLRVFIGDSDRFEHRPLHEAIVHKARELGLAGATVLRGSEGFGMHSVVHTGKILDLSADLPIVIEIVDSAEQIQLLLPHLEAMVQEGMITMEYVVILLYRHGEESTPAPTP